MITFRANRPLNALAPERPTLPRNILLVGAENSLTFYLAHALRESGVAVSVQAIVPETILAARRAFKVVEQSVGDIRFGEALEELQPDVIIHAPAEPPVSQASLRPQALFNRLIEKTAIVCEAVRKHAPRSRLMLISSADVYGDCAAPACEEQPPVSTTMTGRYALMSEQIAQDFASTHQLDLTIARTGSVYGPAVRNNPVHDVLFNLLGPQGTDSHIPLDPHAVRDLLHAADYVEAVKILLSKASSGIYNVASGSTLSLDELNTHFCDILEMPHLFHRAEPTTHSPQRQWLSIERLASLGFRPEVPLHEGLRGYISWWTGIKAA